MYKDTGFQTFVSITTFLFYKIEACLKVSFLLKGAIKCHSLTQACHYLIPHSRKIIAIILNGPLPEISWPPGCLLHLGERKM